jgi:hypothetical protein
MTRDEYESRRRRLGEELRAAIELAEEGHRARVQALDLAWQAAVPGVPAPAASPQPAAKPKRRRRPGELYAEILGFLPQLAQVFSKEDLAPLLPDPPDRASLFRALRELVWNGVLEQEQRGRGTYATTYRQTQRPQRP